MYERYPFFSLQPIEDFHGYPLKSTFYSTGLKMMHHFSASFISFFSRLLEHHRHNANIEYHQLFLPHHLIDNKQKKYHRARQSQD